ncbi:MAG: methylmalonyl-CoA epimerase [Chloroflexota bacterium]
MAVIKVDHVAVVVADMDAALSFWRDAMGLRLERTESNADEAVDIAFLPVGESHVELLAPTTDDSGVARYLEKRGGGLHHLCVAVDDIDLAMSKLVDSGVELINETARTREDGTRYAFVHPRSTGGVLVELYQYAGTVDSESGG